MTDFFDPNVAPFLNSPEFSDTLLGLGTGLISGSGPSFQPGGTARGLAQGIELANRLSQQRQLNAFREQQIGLRQQANQRAQASFEASQAASQRGQETLNTFLQSLPEGQRAAAAVAPGQAVSAMFREPTSLAQNAIAAGLTPGTPEFEAFIREGALKPRSVVNVASNIPPLEKEEQKEVGKQRAKRFGEISEAAVKARQSDLKLARFKQLMTSVQTGRAAPTKTTLKALARSAGINLSDFGITDDVGAAEAINQLNTQFALDNIQKTKGAVSDNEMRLFAEAAAGLARTPEGNLLIIELQETVNQRQREVAKLARDYRRQNNTLDEGFEDQLDQFHAQNPLFTEDIAARIQALQGTDQPQPTRRLKFDPTTGDLIPVQ